MKLAKIKIQKELLEMLEGNEFPILKMYLSWLRRDGDIIISEVRDVQLNFKLIIEDYCLNEPEALEFWKRLNGNLHWDILNVVEL